MICVVFLFLYFWSFFGKFLWFDQSLLGLNALLFRLLSQWSKEAVRGKTAQMLRMSILLLNRKDQKATAQQK